MKTATPTQISLLAASLLLGPQMAIAADARPDPALSKTAETYRKAVLAGDAAATVATFRADAVEMPPNRPPLRGKAEIEQYYREMFSKPEKTTDFTFSHLDQVTSGDIGYVTGGYNRKITLPSGQAIEDTGNFVVVVRREAGAWKSAYVIYNSQRPSTPGPAAPAAAMTSPFGPLIRSYLALFRRWLIVAGLLLVACCMIVAFRLLITYLHEPATAPHHHGGNSGRAEARCANSRQIPLSLRTGRLLLPY